MYFDSHFKYECFGCEGCAQVCVKDAISMQEDEEGFRYPVIDLEKCVKCGMCQNVCPFEHIPPKHEEGQFVFGGYHLNSSTRFESTSGGAFSAIVDSFCDENYVIFGAQANGLFVLHSYITDKEELGIFRKSKYSQSSIGKAYRNARKFLKEGKKVLFSGTPCQIAGLISYLNITKTDTKKLLTVEVVCEGVPSPLYIRKLNKSVEKRYGQPITSIDYRYTGKSIFSNGTWDFEKMRILIGEENSSENEKYLEKKNKPADNKIEIVKDRWFNPFWSIWLQHLMSRPSCYRCPFTTLGRVADITLGDLWGVHIYCPELYGKNGGASLVICNSEKGKEYFGKAQHDMFGHELEMQDALKYQGPLKKPISENPNREKCIHDLKSDMDFNSINRKWANAPSLKLLIQKYIWGNRQKIFVWNLRRKMLEKR